MPINYHQAKKETIQEVIDWDKHNNNNNIYDMNNPININYKNNH